MSNLLTVTGRDVLFAHWPVDQEALASRIPDPLEPATFDGSAWVSVLALENATIAPGSGRLPAGVRLDVPQLNLRTYVTLDGELGVYFRSLDAGDRGAAAAGRSAFALPFRTARMRLTRREDAITFQSRRGDGSGAVFQARYRPTGESYRATPDSLEEFCVERSRYYVPPSDDRRLAPLRRTTPRDGVLVGQIDRDPWELRPVEATIRRNTLFEAADLPSPTGDPTFQYSPGFEMGVRPLARWD